MRVRYAAAWTRRKISTFQDHARELYHLPQRLDRASLSKAQYCMIKGIDKERRVVLKVAGEGSYIKLFKLPKRRMAASEPRSSDRSCGRNDDWAPGGEKREARSGGAAGAGMHVESYYLGYSADNPGPQKGIGCVGCPSGSQASNAINSSTHFQQI